MVTITYELVAFALFAAITLGSSLAVVLVRDVWHAALLLGVALLSVAVHFVMLWAEFLAAMQVLVYVGGVLILISFAVMLTRRNDLYDPGVTVWPSVNVGSHLTRGIASIALLAVLATVVLRSDFGTPAGFEPGSITGSIGYAIIGLPELATHNTEGFLVVLIVVAILLDAALDGSVMLASREPEDRGRATDGGPAAAGDDGEGP